MTHQIERHDVSIVLDPAGHVVGGSATTLYNDGTYRVVPLAPGPFDSPSEALREAVAALDLQLRLW